MRYRAYFLDSTYRYVDAKCVEGDCDETAIAEAARLMQLGGFCDFELWQGPRSIYLCQQRGDGKAPIPRLRCADQSGCRA